jgi:hypothetical protein
MSSSLGLCWRQHCQFLPLAFSLKTVFEKELIKTRLPSMLNQKLSKNVYLEEILWVVQ